jgi:hypothetical protein
LKTQVGFVISGVFESWTAKSCEIVFEKAIFPLGVKSDDFKKYSKLLFPDYTAM